MDRRLSPKGFTMVELMIVVAIIAILATVAIPRFSNAIRGGNEGATRAKPATFRAAVNMFYANQDGVYPADVSVITQPGSKYLSKGVGFWTQAHGNSATVNSHAAVDRTLDSGGWGYANVAGEGFGTVWIECTHTDIKGTAWAAY